MVNSYKFNKPWTISPGLLKSSPGYWNPMSAPAASGAASGGATGAVSGEAQQQGRDSLEGYFSAESEVLGDEEMVLRLQELQRQRQANSAPFRPGWKEAAALGRSGEEGREGQSRTLLYKLLENHT